MTLGPVYFAAPLWLLALVLVPGAFWFWRAFYRSLPSPAPSGAVVPYLRSAALLALVLSLAGTHWISRVPGVDIHVLVDRSASINTAAKSVEEEAIDLLGDLVGPNDRIAVYAFGRETLVERGLSGDLDGFALRTDPDATATHIEDALRSVAQRILPGVNSRILLFSDGIETDGVAESAAALLAARNIPVDVVPLGAGPDIEVAVEHLLAPAFVNAGEPYAIRAVLASTQPTFSRLALYREGTLVAQREVELREGINVVRFDGLVEPVDTSGGSTAFELRIEPLADTFRENNVAHATVQAGSGAPILVISQRQEDALWIADLVAGEQLHVHPATPETAPLDAESLTAFQAIILHDTPVSRLSRRQLDAIVHFVEEVGGGMLVIGGEESYGLGGYQNTALEQILPVAMDAPQDVIMPSLAMVLVLDRSGSMAETQGAFSKLDLAKEAALGVLDVIHDHDLLGILAFDSNPRWVVQLQPVLNRLAFAAPIAAISPEGGTSLDPALREATASLEAANAAVKHIIVLTDGRSTPADFETLTRDARLLGITVSTVGIGRDADRELLRRMAEWGGGRFYFTEDIQAVPQIFATETIIVSRPIRIDEPFAPVWEQPGEFWTSEGPLPRLGGYVITTPKSAAAVHIASPEGNPILATWRRGLGRTAAFTSNILGPWAADWPAWAEAAAFWRQLVRWLMKAGPSEGLIPQLTLNGNSGELVVDAVDREGRFINFLPLEASVWTPGGTQFTVPLAQTGPGRYEGRFPAGEPGAYLATVSARFPEQPGAPQDTAIGGTVTVGAVLSYPDEFRVLRPQTGLLHRLAQATGGTVITAPSREALAPIFSHPRPARRPESAVPVLLFLAFALFLSDIALRYLSPEALAHLRRITGGVPGEPRAPGIEEELKARMEAHQSEWDEEMRTRWSGGSPVDQSAQSASAGKYLASRKKQKEPPA